MKNLSVPLRRSQTHSFPLVSTGTIRQFGRFERQTRQVAQDLNRYRVPTDVDELLQILDALL